MALEIKKGPIPDKAPSSGRAGRTERDSQGGDKFDAVQDKIARYIAIKFTYDTELKSSINKLQQINITKPSAPEADVPQLDKDIYEEEIQEYVKEKKALKRGEAEDGDAF
eukprot:3873084-Ditylum_brightwellii.AAC.1